MFSKSSLLAAVLVAPLVLAVPSPTETAKRSTCTVDSVDSASDISDCSTVEIQGFTVADGDTLTFSFADGASVTMTGDITFASTTASGPLVTLEGTDITFNGGDRTFDGNGADYWDGEGTNGGKAKPHPFMKIKASGLFEEFTVLNTPAQAISVGNDAALTISKVTVNNKAGDTDSLGHNTDGFDVSASNVKIANSVVENQDDCIAINSGSNIIFEDNTCSGGHGMSIGSIASGKTVSGVKFAGNTVTDSMYGVRIKVDQDATSGSVSNVTYSGNTISGISEYGVLITQSYPDNDGTPGTDTTISDVNFDGEPNTITVDSSAYNVVVDCGDCTGTWDWNELTVSGGKSSEISADDATINGGSY
ncbi:glycoside hydrolase family 28 protein [Wolfiporia cocos MD-104 SS10]|uniref:endo-polygalacturonase n=1 Tax=Wolfiporia cocos (strain MD-104) TaxID=742152 RepID=A0A2H3J1P6_WOLCO|nr:glycoside hydrolase family 28 protein [Wolfiporia cocos MD-104 SS10]